MNKLLIRAEILSAISKIQSGKSLSENKIGDIIEKLKQIDDVEFVLQVLLKELCKSDSDERLAVISFIFPILIPMELADEKVKEILCSDEVADSQKYKLIKLMRNIGLNIDYDQMMEYLNEPESVINTDTTILLESSFLNPELQIDFLDFFASVSTSDGALLVDSLVKDYPENMLTALLLPMLFAMNEADFFPQIIEVLGDTKSLEALKALEKIMPSYEDNEEIYIKIKKSINKLKLSTPKQQEFVSPVIKDTRIYKAFISVPDGAGNIGIIVSRQRTDNTYQIFATVISLYGQVVDSFGFNEISYPEFVKIISKFYDGEQQFEIPPEIAKFLLEKAVDDAIKTKKKIPYEYVCWSPLLSDIEDVDAKSCFKIKSQMDENPTPQEMTALYLAAPECKKWFYDEKTLEFKSLIDELINQVVIDKSVVNESYMKGLIGKHFDTIFTEEEHKVFDYKLMISAYLYDSIGKVNLADLFRKLLEVSESRTEFLYCILVVSIYLYFEHLQYKQTQEERSENLFQSRKVRKHIVTNDVIIDILELIRKTWNIDE